MEAHIASMTFGHAIKAFKATWDNTSESEMEEEQDEVANLCFMALEDDIEVCLKSTRIKNKWYLDSGCSRHMTGDKD